MFLMRFLFWLLIETIIEAAEFILWKVWAFSWPLLSIWMGIKVAGYFTP